MMFSYFSFLMFQKKQGGGVEGGLQTGQKRTKKTTLRLRRAIRGRTDRRKQIDKKLIRTVIEVDRDQTSYRAFVYSLR